MSSEIRANTLKNRVGLSTISITDTGIVVSGVTTCSGIVQAIQFKLLDNAKAVYGNSGDMEIYHNATNSLIQNGTGALQIVTSSDLYQQAANNISFNTGGSNERLRITSGGDLRLGLNSVAEQTDSAHYIMTLTGKSGQTGAGAIAFKDPSANTDGFIFADSGNLFITADYSNATADSSIRFRVDGSSEKLRITSYNGGASPKVSVGALANSSHLNNSIDGDRSTIKVGNYLHLDSGGNGNFTAGMTYNCWPQGQQNFYQGTMTASNADNRAAAVLMRYGRTEFWNDNSNTGYTDAQQITTMQNNMTVHAAGSVTTPNQPAFKCSIATDSSPNSGIVSENNGFTLATSSSRDAFNTGSHFDEATGKFTAPVTGLYYFHFSLMRNSSNGSGPIEMRIKRNGGNIWARAYKGSYTSSFQSDSVTTITNLDAGHYVEFYIGSNMSTYFDDSYMLGYLIG